jgi:hypothetical protein
MIGNLGSGILKVGGLAEKAGMSFSNWASDGEQAGSMFGRLGMAAASVAPVLATLAGGAIVLGGALLVLPALAAAAAFALTFLLDAATTLAAILGGLVAPLSLLAGLLGLLGGGFFLAGQRAMQGGGQFAAIGTKVEHLTGQFKALIRTLASDFEPIFWRIANVAQIALNYFDKLAHMDNLRQAFRSLSTEGVSLLNKLVYGAGNLLARPFRMAVHFAFDSNGMAGAVTSWWTSLTNYLFGYSKMHPIPLAQMLAQGMPGQQLKHHLGALNPISEWFGKQNFTKTGQRWSNEIIDGFIHSKGAKNLAQWASTAAGHAGHEAGIAFRAALTAEITSGLSSLGKWFRNHTLVPGLDSGPIFKAFDAIKTYALSRWSDIKGWIESHVPTPHLNIIGWLKTAEGIWDSIVSYVESHIPHPSISVGFHMPSLDPLHYVHPATGGLVMPGGALKLAGGGFVGGGTPGRDSVPALLTPGELVLNREQQKRLFEGGQSGPMVLYLDLGAGIRKRIDLTMKQTARGLEARGKWGDH